MLFSKAGPPGSVLVDSGLWVLIFIIKGKWDSRLKNFFQCGEYTFVEKPSRKYTGYQTE